MLKVLFFFCLLSIEYLATTSVHIGLVESMWDKSNHFIAFFVLYILLSLSYQELQIVKKFFLLLVFGVQIELVQELIGRSEFSVLDVLADSIGIIIGMTLYHFFGAKLEKLVAYFTKI